MILHPKFILKNRLDYLCLLFVIISFFLYNYENRQGLSIYYFLIISVFIILKFSEEGFINFFGFSLKGQRKKIGSFVFIIGLTMIVSNVLLFKIKTIFLNSESAYKNYFDYDYLYTFLIFNTVRIFGEELIFRGFLLIKEIKENNSLFCLLNFAQAALFALIHSFFNDEIIEKLVFTSYVFVFSVLVGWLNRKYSSLFPSWLIHLGNGLQNFIFIFT